MKSLPLLVLTLILLTGCVNNTKPVDPESAEEVRFIDFHLVGKLAHDTTSFTEGLFFHGNDLFESTGSPPELSQTRSVIGIVNPETGKIHVKVELDKKAYFGEGIVHVKNKIFQLTYKNQVRFVYDASSYEKIGQYKYSNAEGWGLTTNGTDIIMSDGTDQLTFRNADNFEVIKVLPVRENGYVITYLNELEYINGCIYANVWLTNNIIKIDPSNGKVIGKFDLTPVYQKEISSNPGAGEMNGIAYNPSNKQMYITGKLWANIYQIGFAP